MEPEDELLGLFSDHLQEAVHELEGVVLIREPELSLLHHDRVLPDRAVLLGRRGQTGVPLRIFFADWPRTKPDSVNVKRGLAALNFLTLLTAVKVRPRGQR